MKNKIIFDTLDEVLSTHGYKKKKYTWHIKCNNITKIVVLQKSSYGEYYFVNYGFIIESIPLDNLEMHIFHGLGSVNRNENSRIKELLDTENTIFPEARILELKKIFLEKLLVDLDTTNSEQDILNQLKQRNHLNDIPIIVKKHFNLNDAN